MSGRAMEHMKTLGMRVGETLAVWGKPRKNFHATVNAVKPKARVPAQDTTTGPLQAPNPSLK
jgi:hypothetical protein